MPLRYFFAFVPLLLAAPAFVVGQSTTPLPILFDITLAGQRLEGMPLAWSKEKVFLLGRDGVMSSFDPRTVGSFQKTNRAFEPYTAQWMKTALSNELGADYDVSESGRFLVAHPRGQGRQWVDRFDELSRAFTMYFKVRGFELREPAFPLIAVVYRTREEFQRAVISQGMTPGEHLIGCYLSSNNRTAMFDLDQGRGGANRAETLATVVHEASHQLAFNTGIHSRWAPPPRWVAEGLGTMFEARGVWDSQAFPNRADRINRERLEHFRAMRKTRKPDAVLALLRDDRPFDAAVLDAYAEAWALTFYLVETYPREYAQYLKKTGDAAPSRRTSRRNESPTSWRCSAAIFACSMRAICALSTN
ncbi:MAG: DUF1570 domain-containing protein [Pirellulales bacterium]